MKHKKLFTSAFILISISLVIGVKIYSQQIATYGLVLNEIKKEYTMLTGQTIKDSFKAKHDFQDVNYVANLYVVTQDFESDGVSGQPKLVSKERLKPFTTLEDWITVEDQSVTLSKYGESKEINYTISVPEDAQPGSYYAAIMLTDTNGEIPVSSNQVGVESRIGMLVLLTVLDLTDISGNPGGQVKISSVEIVNKSLQPPFLGIFDYEPTIFDINIKQEGPFYSIPEGDIYIYQTDITKPVATGKFNPNRDAVLGNSTRQFLFQWDEDVKPVKKEELDQLPDFKLQSTKQIPIGSYNASFKILYIDKQTNSLQYVDQTVSFIVFPWKLTLAVIAIIIIIYIMIRVYINRSVKSQLKRQMLLEEKSI